MLIRLRPRGPWRYGPGDGASDRVDVTFRSDRLYSALTLAMRQLGFLELWLNATARTDTPSFAWSSLFPFQGDTLFAPPPATAWPPRPQLVASSSPIFLSKMRWNAVRFVPLSLIESILMGQQILADQWLPDPESGCLLRRDRPSISPFRASTRFTAPVDRLSGLSRSANSLACIEFEPSSGLWAVIRFRDVDAESVWADRIAAGFRLLADSGFGARRTCGWGHADTPEIQRGAWPDLLLPKAASAIASNGNETGSGITLYWLLSLYSPASADAVDWSLGNYQLTIRGGRVDNAPAAVSEKKAVRMITEGSVIAALSELAGAFVNVAPDYFSRPIRRAGLALALALPAATTAPAEHAVEMRPEGMGAVSNGAPVESTSTGEPSAI
jgi:CRISPR type III-A-associated RAMP protein Csm4